MKQFSKNGFGFDGGRNFDGLRRYFIVPPFSILRALDGEWVKRKRAWIRLGIKSEVGRNNGKEEDQPAGISGRNLGGGYTINADKYEGGCTEAGRGFSVFDPTLCELVYRWFCVPDGLIIDPFAGGSVRGIVAHVLGYTYWGCELRPEQVKANREQAAGIIPERSPIWVCGDSRKSLLRAPDADLIFSCPPYGNLEVYSDLPGDISNMEYPEFRNAYLKIIKKSVVKLRNNRFAVFVVGNFRNKQGFYHDFVGDTVRCFKRAGMGYYNEFALSTAIGSLHLRITRQFQSGRKAGKTHQNVLVFYKGDPKQIKEEFGPVNSVGI